ncbi:MAG: PLP-dependent aminotransferase family protein [Propioniciclava sp.]|uniref:aminotransferase-like domain-containing protein n=1 Tax=Propioniciclava sp. TaxID=2038686 RepID=UPI0039E4B634
MSSLEPSRRDTRLDSHIDQYADRTGSMTVSAVRALFSVANRPEVVSLAGGMPNIADLPLARLGDSFDRLVQTHGIQAMQYGSGQGELFMREKICEVMAEEAVVANPDDVVITCGSQQALDLVTRIFINPGDVILCEAPSYVGAMGTFNAYQARIHHVAMDEHGLIPQALEQAIVSLRAAGQAVKFLYTIPNFNNPTGITQPIERRREILDVTRKHGLLVVEDNPYGLLTIEGEPVDAMRSMDDDIVYLGSFSKTFAPGFRIGWVLAPHAVRERLVIAQEAAVLSPPVFSQFAIADYLDNFDWRGQIESFRSMYAARRDAMLHGLEAFMPPGTTWTVPNGGFFVWVTLPEGLDSQALLPRAVTERVAFVPGTAFYADGFGSRNMRLSFCFPTPERIIEGCRRLGKAIADELEMHNTFGLGTDEHRHRPVSGPAPNVS